MADSAGHAPFAYHGRMEPMRVVHISDFICPWCYLGVHRLERLRQEFALAVEFLPWLLRPDLPAGARREELYGGAARMANADARIRAFCEEERLAFVPPSRVPDTRPAHALVLAAGRVGRGDEATVRCFDAHFARGEPIDDPAFLSGLASELRVEPPVGGWSGEAARAAVLAAVEGAREWGVEGTPTMHFPRGFYVVGAQDMLFLRSACRRLGAPPATDAPVVPTEG